MKAADLVVLPFTEILNSGSAILALSFNRPLLVPSRGAMAELFDIIGPDWVRLYDGPLTSQILEEAVLWANEKSSSSAVIDLGRLDWDKIGQLTVEAFTTLHGSLRRQLA